MKVGDYVRTKKGIAKYLGLGRDILKHEANKGTYEHYYNQHLFDNYVFDVGHDYGDTLIYDEFNNIDKLGKVKENIIDLIEVGDLVRLFMEDDVDKEDTNIFEVIAITDDKKEIGVFTKDCELDFYPIENLRGIVTSKQFSQMEYRIGE